MKVDGLGVILAIILMPILLIVTYYIQMQVDTIATENNYNTKLLDATYDAMSAFEINTANEELSTVADSMRSIVLASNNIFLNTLATNLGMSNASKESLQEYIPAVLYTMYDGFYIYSPTEVPVVAEKTTTENAGTEDELITTNGYYSVGDEPEGFTDTSAQYGDLIYKKDGGGYTTKKSEAETEQDYVLKSYIPYSANYQWGSNNVTINYTLDNYLNIEGTVNGIYYTKTGYLIDNSLVTNIKADGTEYTKTQTNEDDIEDIILGKRTNADETTTAAAGTVSVTVGGQTISANFSNVQNENTEIKTISDAEAKTDLTNLQIYEIQKYKAIAYYASSACFSSWVYTNLGDIKGNNIVDTAMTGYYGVDDDGNKLYNTTAGSDINDFYYDFSNDSSKIFVTTGEHKDPEDTESTFYTHKMEVIKNSIKYNLNLSMSAYSKMSHQYDWSLPVLLDEEWDKILNNISIVAFMQGWDCGLDIYNNYQIVSSTNNELTVTPNEIFYVKADEFNNKSSNYHRIDCEYLDEDGREFISFTSKEIKYDKVYDQTTGKYTYDHQNLACYTCINNSNYTSLFTDPTNTSYYAKIKTLKAKKDSTSADSDNKKLAGYIGLANARQSIYKTNALPMSEGYKVFNDAVSGADKVTWSTSLGSNIKELQITLSNIEQKIGSGVSREPILKLNIKLNGEEQGISRDIPMNSLKDKVAKTINIEVPSDIKKISTIVFEKDTPNTYTVNYTIESIKAIYK